MSWRDSLQLSATFPFLFNKKDNIKDLELESFILLKTKVIKIQGIIEVFLEVTGYIANVATIFSLSLAILSQLKLTWEKELCG